MAGLPSSDDWHNIFALSEYPGDSQLCRGASDQFSDVFEAFDQLKIGREIVSLEAWCISR